MKEENKEKLQSLYSRVCTKKNGKRLLAMLIICAFAGGGFSWYHHQQKVAHRALVQEEQTKIVQYQASKQGLSLLSEDQIKYVVADAIDKDVTTLSFRNLTLKGYDEKAQKKAAKRDDRKASAPAPAPQSTTPQKEFHPVYTVNCTDGTVHYKARVDAVTGTVLSLKAH